MNIYYSRSNEVDDTKYLPLIAQFIDNLPKYDGSEHILTKHSRGSVYKPQLVTDADLIIVATPNEELTKASIAKGCYDEIDRALQLDKLVLVIGTFSHDEPFIQNIKAKDLTIENSTCWQVGYGTVYVTNKPRYSEDVGIDLEYIKNYYASVFNTEADVDTLMTYLKPDLLNNKVIRTQADYGKWNRCEDQSNTPPGFTKVQRVESMRIRHKLVKNPEFDGQRVESLPSYDAGRADGEDELLLI